MKVTVIYNGSGHLSDRCIETLRRIISDYPYIIELKAKFDSNRIKAWNDKQKVLLALKTEEDFEALFDGRVYPKNPIKDPLKYGEDNYAMNGMFIAFKTQFAYDLFLESFEKESIKNPFTLTYSYDTLDKK